MSWLPKHKVLVPVDFSFESLAAVDAALELLDSPTHLYVIHVLPVLTDFETGILHTAIDEESQIQHSLEALQTRLAGDKYAGFHPHVTFGDPGHAIAEYAEEIGAELIVIPSHGRKGLTRLLIGSTAERVLRLAPCPVLVLKAPHAAAKS